MLTFMLNKNDEDKTTLDMFFQLLLCSVMLSPRAIQNRTFVS